MSKAMDNTKDFAEWLQDRMTQLDLSQSELARRANVDRQVIWGYLSILILSVRIYKMLTDMLHLWTTGNYNYAVRSQTYLTMYGCKLLCAPPPPAF